MVGESGVGQVAHGARHRAAHRGARPGDRDPAALPGHRPARGAPSADHRHLLGTSMSMVFQDPGTSFNPTRRIGGQLAEVGRYHLGMSRSAAHDRAIDRLRAVHVPAPERRAGQYPHELSGGLRQRAMIGMGLMGSPALIIADEPTTALDVTIQQQVLQLLQTIRADDRGRHPAHQPRRGRGPPGVRPGAGHVRGPHRGGAARGRPRHRRLGIPTRAPSWRRCRTWTATWTGHSPSSRAVPWSPSDVPVGCAYAARCPLADQHCLDEDPPLVADARRSSGGLLARGRAAPGRRADLADGGVMSGLRFEDVSVRYGSRATGVTAVDRVSLDVPPGQRRGPGRRIGLRQVHPGAGRGRHRAARRGSHPVRRCAPAHDGPAPHPDGVPGPLLLPRPADDHR